jgi:hypothetical protein
MEKYTIYVYDLDTATPIDDLPLFLFLADGRRVIGKRYALDGDNLFYVYDEIANRVSSWISPDNIRAWAYAYSDIMKVTDTNIA